MCSIVLIMLMNSNACEPPNKSVELGRFTLRQNGSGYEAVCDFSVFDDHGLPDDRRSGAAPVGGASGAGAASREGGAGGAGGARKVVREGAASGTPGRGGGGFAEWKDLCAGRLGARAGRSTAR